MKVLLIFVTNCNVFTLQLAALQATARSLFPLLFVPPPLA